jgi:hypothetical protein
MPMCRVRARLWHKVWSVTVPNGEGGAITHTINKYILRDRVITEQPKKNLNNEFSMKRTV